MNIKEAYEQHKTLKIMRETAKELEAKFKGFGFCLLVFEFNRPGISNYISNTERKSMIESLRETADRLEKNQDFNN